MATKEMFNGHVGKIVIRGSFTLTTAGAVLAVLPARGRIFTVAHPGVGQYTVTFDRDKFPEISFASAKYNSAAAAGSSSVAQVTSRTGGSATANASILITVSTLDASAVAAAADLTSGSVDFEIEAAYFSGNE
jgi:hypothetical protein